MSAWLRLLKPSARSHQGASAPRANDDGDAEGLLFLPGDQSSHQRKQLVAEERIQRAVVDAHRLALEHLDLGEPGAFELRDEVTLRQCPRQSAGPCGRMGKDFRGELVLVDGEVRDAELATWP